MNPEDIYAKFLATKEGAREYTDIAPNATSTLADPVADVQSFVGPSMSWSMAPKSLVKSSDPLDDLYPPTGTKHDNGKPMMSLIDPYVMTEMAKVLTFGAKKYDPDNWRKGFNLRRVLDACLRHIQAWSSGQDNDDETGLSHLAHAMCCLMFLMWLYKFKPHLDDRYKEPEV